MKTIVTAYNHSAAISWWKCPSAVEEKVEFILASIDSVMISEKPQLKSPAVSTRLSEYCGALIDSHELL